MNLLLYGLGHIAELIEKKIKDEHRIVGYIDSNYNGMYNNKMVCTPNFIRDIEYDYIIISVSSKKLSLQLKKNLIEDYGICSDRIVPFTAWMETQKYKIISKMLMGREHEVNGIIIGNSHAQYGILPECLKDKFINLSISSQDIFNSCGIISEILKGKNDRWREMKYLIFDLFDYNYFNIDTSLTNRALIYVEWGGRINERNFKNNGNWNNNFDVELINEYGIDISNEKKEIMSLLFDEDWLLKIRSGTDEDSYNRWYHIEKTDIPLENRFDLSSIKHHRSFTINDNISILENTIGSVKEEYPNLNIIFTLLPRYIATEKKAIIVEQLWKEEFQQIVLQICSKYNIKYWNYKNLIEISNNHFFYYDQEHLNTIGARAMTSIINRQIQSTYK